MRTRHTLLALAMAVAMTASSRAASIRDTAGLFSADAVRSAEAELNRIERQEQLPTTIETVESLDGQSMDEAIVEHARRAGATGLFVLISKSPHKIEADSSHQYRRAMTRQRLQAIRQAFLVDFKAGELDKGLTDGVKAIGSQAAEARAEFGTLREATAPNRGGAAAFPRRGGRQGGGSFGLGSLLGLGLVILVVMFVIRAIGAAFGGGARRGYGAPGMGGGYGGGGGGFMSSMFGGIGGALAGNWLYDQFSGRNHGSGYGENSTYPTDSQTTDGGDDWSSGASSGAADWGDSGGGGGDWGGGDGGGGDW